MFKLSYLTVGLCLSIATLAHAAQSTGFRQIELTDIADRPLNVAIWYPTKNGNNNEATAIGENVVFYGIDAIKDATPDDGTHPLIVFSHGYGGNWRNLNWLAELLVNEGYVVAAPDHPGTTTFNKDAVQAARLWERPHDLSRVLDALITQPKFAGKIDAQHIAAIGHSLGGWTVTALAGGRYDVKLFEKECQINAMPRVCSLITELGLDDVRLEKEMRDPRIKAFITLDLGLARGFTPTSLSDIDIASLVIGAAIDIGDMPIKLESGYLKQYLTKPSSTYVEIPDAMHFSFLQSCKAGAVELIEEETPGDGIVCKDDGHRKREEIHREISFLVIGFLSQNLGINP
ncbi:alpha/beta hydrolase family protein [Brucellaceae bacterium C25G]